MLQGTEESENNTVNLMAAEGELKEEKHNLGSYTGLDIKSPVLLLFPLTETDIPRKINRREFLFFLIDLFRI